MKALLAIVLAFAITPAFAGTKEEDYSACKVAVKAAYPENKVKLKKIKRNTIEIQVITPANTRSTVACNRDSLALSEK
jgi:hypothetical protein